MSRISSNTWSPSSNETELLEGGGLAINPRTWSPSSNEVDLLEGGGLVVGPMTWSPSSNEADLLEGGGVIYSIDDLMPIIGAPLPAVAATKPKKVRGGGAKCRKGYGFVNHRYRNLKTGKCVSKATATGRR